MLVLRLQRTGRRNIPAYRLAVAEKRAAVKGKVQEYLGHYLPTRNPHVFEFQRERVEHWIGRGAQPSDTAARLLRRAGVAGLEKFIKAYTKRKSKAKDVSPGLPARPAAGSDGQPGDAGEARVVETPDQPSLKELRPAGRASQENVEEKKKEG